MPGGDQPVQNNGHYEYIQDPHSGAFIRTWIPDTDNPDTPNVDESSFKCMVRAGMTTGIVNNGAGDVFTGTKFKSEMTVRITYGINEPITNRDKITNIADNKGRVIFTEDNGNPTIFDVESITPVQDAFSMLVEYTAILTKSEVQNGTSSNNV